MSFSEPKPGTLSPAEAFGRYRIAVLRARARIMEIGMEDIAETLNPWLFGPKSVTRAIQITQDRGEETVTWHEVLNLLIIADRDPVLRLSCDLQGLPTGDEWLQAGP